uniref:Protein kinase domain-containing protein n=1 Tax=Aegilops tauschii subsp. strangulata TaxID=200361 RepID=A0A452Z4C5_AEGTS
MEGHQGRRRGTRRDVLRDRRSHSSRLYDKRYDEEEKSNETQRSRRRRCLCELQVQRPAVSDQELHRQDRRRRLWLEGLRQGEKQFRAEVSTLGTIQHVNLIRMLGFCSDGGDRKLLVYDYMPNGSLDRHLFRKTFYVLSWQVRYQVTLGVAKGLAYLHDKCRDCIIHCDVKPENILLDASFGPKVADFGLAKLVGRDFSRVLTTMRGTVGYLAPEWISGEAITAKADVFSYGMMLFEIVSGRRNIEQGERRSVVSAAADAEEHPTTTFFPLLVARKLAEGDVMTLLDPELEGDANAEEMRRVCKVACWCIQRDVDTRPAMGEVVQVLEGL